MTTNEYGNGPIAIGVGWDMQGVKLYGQHPITKKPVLLLVVEPQFARSIAEKITLASFECDDARDEDKKKSSGG